MGEIHELFVLALFPWFGLPGRLPDLRKRLRRELSASTWEPSFHGTPTPGNHMMSIPNPNKDCCFFLQAQERCKLQPKSHLHFFSNSRVVADVWKKDVWEFQAKSGSSGSCRLFLHFLGKIAVQEMSGKTPGSPRHPSSRHPRPSENYSVMGSFEAGRCRNLSENFREISANFPALFPDAMNSFL